MIIWNDLPLEIQNRMLEHQEKQGHLKNPDVFKKEIGAGLTKKGFVWEHTIEGVDFWFDILHHGKFNIFYDLYPKKNVSERIDEVLNKLKKYEETNMG